MSPQFAELEAESLGHLDGLYAFALHLTREPAAAERLIADTIRYARDRWELFRLGSNARVWLFTVAHRPFVGRRRRGSSGHDEDDAIVSAPDWSSPARTRVFDGDGGTYEWLSDDDIMRAIDALPGDCRAPVFLVDLQGFRYAEVAEVLGLPERTVTERLADGRRWLEQRLAGGDAAAAGKGPPEPTGR